MEGLPKTVLTAQKGEKKAPQKQLVSEAAQGRTAFIRLLETDLSDNSSKSEAF